MPRYILIDNYSGFIWGDSADLQGRIFQGAPIEFAKALDESIGATGRVYEMQWNKPHDIRSGYHVYRADVNGSEAVPVVTDGEDQDMIDAVTRDCQYECFISFSYPEIDE